MNKNKNNLRCCEQAFTLIEMIGVMAIIAILAAVIAPNVVKQMQAAGQDAEEEALDVLAEGLIDYVLENRIIPQSDEGLAAWANNIATQTNLPTNMIFQNDLGNNRRYWFDPATDLNGLSNNSASYDQNTVAAANLSGDATTSTASAPTNPRAMIISDLSAGGTNNILVASVAHNAANFAAAWDQTGILTESSTLKIKRINLARLFNTVTLSNEIPVTLPESFQYLLEGQAGNSIINITLAGTPEIVSFNVIDGTTLYLYDELGGLLRLVVIKESEGFTYKQGPPTSWEM